MAILFLSFFVGSASSVWQQLEKCLLSNREDVVSCPVCGVSVQKVSYKRHMDIHDKAVAFNCYICHKSFKRKDNLKRHLKSHLMKTMEMNKQNWIHVSIFNFIVCEYKYFNKFCINLWRIFFSTKMATARDNQNYHFFLNRTFYYWMYRRLKCSTSNYWLEYRRVVNMYFVIN